MSQKITSALMRNILFILFGVIGIGLVLYSIASGWISWAQGNQFGMSIETDPIVGYKYWQGIAAGIAAIVAAGLLFVKPKIAILPALAASAFALQFKLTPPIAEIGEFKPLFAVTLAIIGGAVLAVAGLVAPSKK